MFKSIQPCGIVPYLPHTYTSGSCDYDIVARDSLDFTSGVRCHMTFSEVCLDCDLESLGHPCRRYGFEESSWG